MTFHMAELHTPPLTPTQIVERGYEIERAREEVDEKWSRTVTGLEREVAELRAVLATVELVADDVADRDWRGTHAKTQVTAVGEVLARWHEREARR